jgi:hypothetical protein
LKNYSWAKKEDWGYEKETWSVGQKFWTTLVLDLLGPIKPNIKRCKLNILLIFPTLVLVFFL